MGETDGARVWGGGEGVRAIKRVSEAGRCGGDESGKSFGLLSNMFDVLRTD